MSMTDRRPFWVSRVLAGRARCRRTVKSGLRFDDVLGEASLQHEANAYTESIRTAQAAPAMANRAAGGRELTWVLASALPNKFLTFINPSPPSVRSPMLHFLI